MSLLEQVTTMNDVYQYLQESFISGLYGDTRGFLGDGKTYRVGRARLRQVRIAPGKMVMKGSLGDKSIPLYLYPVQ